MLRCWCVALPVCCLVVCVCSVCLVWFVSVVRVCVCLLSAISCFCFCCVFVCLFVCLFVCSCISLLLAVRCIAVSLLRCAGVL